VVPLVIAAVLSVALNWYVWSSYGAKFGALLVVGLFLGLALFHSRFGFTSAWRQLVAVGQGKALRAHTVMLGACALFFAPILATGAGFAGVHAHPSSAPFGLSVAIGAFLFGIGMQLGGACASGTLFAVGSGQSSVLLTLIGFIAGGTLGAATMGFWSNLPSAGAISLAQSRLGYGGALVVTLVVPALIALFSRWLERRRTPPPVAPVATAKGAIRVLRGSWPLWVGAVVIAALNAVVLLTSGSAWGITSAFALWGSKIYAAFGGDPSGWLFWSGPRAASVLHGSVFNDLTSLTDFGVMVGALIASAAAGAFTLHRRIPGRLALGAVLGGIIMGYGSRMAYGCNIGAYLDGIASGSLYGWLWGVAALAGTWAGLRLRPLFGLANPKPNDSVC
jgi:uncharacterized membrane protein YedE/YeeE